MNRILTILILLLSLRTMAGEQATAEATLTAGFVTGITVTFAGSGYTSKPMVTISEAVAWRVASTSSCFQSRHRTPRRHVNIIYDPLQVQLRRLE